LPLYQSQGSGLLERLSGIFAFVLHDRRTGDFLIARDPIGVNPLYTGRDEHGNLCVASEMKALAGACRKIEDFPPGHYLTAKMEAPAPYYQPGWKSFAAVKDNPLDLDRLRESFTAAVHRQMMSDVPYGVLVSGGLDSSLVAAVAARFAETRI